mmetsp:Transcript_111994/g.316836  ORF Transcript_111994/g.316836 Transcript_111994/m.316836 type:complete len:216 (-) Transcript_111994:16-663(-)
MPLARASMVMPRSSILVSRSCFSRSFFSVCNAFALNSSTHQALCLTSRAFSSRRCAIMTSMAFFARAKASSRTLVAISASLGLRSRSAAAASRPEALLRRSLLADRPCCRSEGLKVRVKRSCASSPLRMERAFETASISSCRVFWRSSHSLSVIWHFSFSIIRNCSSAESDAFVSWVSCFACAFCSSVLASSCVLESICAWPASICACLAAFTSS